MTKLKKSFVSETYEAARKKAKLEEYTSDVNQDAIPMGRGARM